MLYSHLQLYWNHFFWQSICYLPSSSLLYSGEAISELQTFSSPSNLQSFSVTLLCSSEMLLKCTSVNGSKETGYLICKLVIWLLGKTWSTRLFWIQIAGMVNFPQLHWMPWIKSNAPMRLLHLGQYIFPSVHWAWRKKKLWLQLISSLDFYMYVQNTFVQEQYFEFKVCLPYEKRFLSCITFSIYEVVCMACLSHSSFVRNISHGA